MKFKIYSRSFQEKEFQFVTFVHASDWFSAFCDSLEKSNDSTNMQNLDFAMQEDEVSAEVRDKHSQRVFLVQVDNEIDFEVYIYPFESSDLAEIIDVRAEDWFSALCEALEQQGSTVDMQDLGFSLYEDGLSAEVTDSNAGRTFQVRAVQQDNTGKKIAIDLPIPTQQLTSEYTALEAKPLWKTMWDMRRMPWWQTFLYVMLFLSVGGCVFAGFSFLQFPWYIRICYGLVVGSQSVLFLWSGYAVKMGMVEYVERATWQHEEELRSAGRVLLGSFVGSLAYWVLISYTPTRAWLHTAFFMVLLLFYLYGAFSLATALLIRQQVYGGLASSTVKQWIGRSAALSAMTLIAVSFFIFNFVGGMYWWYYTYVTPERRSEVQERTLELRHLQLKTIFDSKKKYLGLYAKTESDWSRYYNDPKLLSWRVSKSIMRAEGSVQKPSWWWRYLPDGDRLLCEPFSIQAFLRVPYYFIKQRRKVGGSTPALQAAKNFLDFGQKRRKKGFAKTIGIKLFEEIPRSYIMSQSFTPREMLATYMATLWSGFGANYGAHRMGLHYFNILEPSKLSWNQSVVLAASLPNPGRFNPWYLRGCREGKCRSRTRAKVYKVWLERIRQLKARLRREGFKIPKEMPKFQSGIHRLGVLSFSWQRHDAHIRSWIRAELPSTIKGWKESSSIGLGYDRELTLGSKKSFFKPKPKSKPRSVGKTLPSTRPVAQKPPTSRPVVARSSSRKSGMVELVKKYLEKFREEVKDVQVSYTLYDSRSGKIVSQYGGDEHVDMVLARKPVVGSTFKVLTMLIGAYWPDNMPLINRGRGPKLKKKRRFIYRPRYKSHGHVVKNSHVMPKFVYKKSAMTMSANIAMVFLSLRWTWFVDGELWNEILRVGLEQMYVERLKYKKQEAHEHVKVLMKNPKKLKNELIRYFGYKKHFRNARKKALFELAKAETVKDLLHSRYSKKALARLLASEENEVYRFSKWLRGRYYGHRWKATQRLQGPVSLELLSWTRTFRIEIGLRYIIHLAKMVSGYKMRRDFLYPVMTMTLGVNNSTTPQLAAIAGMVASQKISKPRIISSLYRGDKAKFKYNPSGPDVLPVPQKSLEDVKDYMNAVLRWGTASRAGYLLYKRYGMKILQESGAKTGTVQNDRGVSCIGYMEHRAGALTISTPNNKRLRTYNIRKSFIRRLDVYKAKVRYWKKRLRWMSPTSWQAKWTLKRLQDEQQKADAQERLIEHYEELAQRFLTMGRTWRRTEQKAKRYRLLAGRFSKRIALARSRSRIYRRYARGDLGMVKLYQKWFKRFDQRALRSIDKSKEKKVGAIEKQRLGVIDAKEKDQFSKEMKTKAKNALAYAEKMKARFQHLRDGARKYQKETNVIYFTIRKDQKREGRFARTTRYYARLEKKHGEQHVHYSKIKSKELIKRNKIVSEQKVIQKQADQLKIGAQSVRKKFAQLNVELQELQGKVDNASGEKKSSFIRVWRKKKQESKESLSKLRGIRRSLAALKKEWFRVNRRLAALDRWIRRVQIRLNWLAAHLAKVRPPLKSTSEHLLRVRDKLKRNQALWQKMKLEAKAKWLAVKQAKETSLSAYHAKLRSNRERSRASRSFQRARYREGILRRNSEFAALHQQRSEQFARDKTIRYHTYKKRIEVNKKRHAKWLRLADKSLLRSKKLVADYQKNMDLSVQWFQKSKEEEIEYEKIEKNVEWTHKRWVLTSTQACLILFELFGYWKDEERRRKRAIRKKELIASGKWIERPVSLPASRPVVRRKRRRWRWKRRRRKVRPDVSAKHLPDAQAKVKPRSKRKPWIRKRSIPPIEREKSFQPALPSESKFKGSGKHKGSLKKKLQVRPAVPRKKFQARPAIPRKKFQARPAVPRKKFQARPVIFKKKFQVRLAAPRKKSQVRAATPKRRFIPKRKKPIVR